MTETTDTRTQILEAAMERILHYGYSKTTMSEIAKDCCMSAGNIYRFFASKLDLAEGMARVFSQKTFERHAIIARLDTPAPDRIREFFHFDLTTTYEAIEADAKILELAQVLKEERPLYFNEQLAQERIYIVQILASGMENGEFRHLPHPDETAEFIQSGLMKFRFPQLFSALTLPKLQRELDGVLDLMLAGIASLEAPKETPKS